MEQSGTLLTTLPEASQVNLTGFIRTLHAPNTIDIVVNGEISQEVSMESGDEVNLETLTFDRPTGESLTLLTATICRYTFR